ncbi:MAG: aminotransferase class I/II-fold pyridoxal phosphate-dependent enzyme [Flavobacteriaceae bacterium]|nr:aminotransferase class I/II-fold pyridoxal phosphate-dependent enzyme [Flavobacteriaceae bacterium]
MHKNNKIYLSPPCVDDAEIKNVCDALHSGWISPLGSFTDDFSNKLSRYFKKKVLLTNSGTSAIHLALRLSGIKENDYVLCSDFTFAATAFPILYQKAIPVFIGSEKETWNLSPEFLNEALAGLKKKNIHPKALVIAHAYGVAAQMDKIINLCKKHNILLIEDAAEALGSLYNGTPLGKLGDYGIVSFNGNKIITCSTGGALILPDDDKYLYAQKLATQAKEKADYYKHDELGYNYAQSNILAAIGNAQFDKLNKKVTRRREIFNYYLSFFKDKIEVSYQKEYKNSFSNRWLSSFIFPESVNKKIKESLKQNNIECRYLWNPLHKQKVFKNYLFYGDKKLEKQLFEQGISLPSGDNLGNKDLQKITGILEKHL